MCEKCGDHIRCKSEPQVRESQGRFSAGAGVSSTRLPNEGRRRPLVSPLSVAVCCVIVTVAGDDAIARLGNPTGSSVGVFLGTLVFPVAAVLGLVAVLRAPRAELRRGLRIYALVAGVWNVVATAYVAWWGVIGWRSWG